MAWKESAFGAHLEIPATVCPIGVLIRVKPAWSRHCRLVRFEKESRALPYGGQTERRAQTFPTGETMKARLRSQMALGLVLAEAMSLAAIDFMGRKACHVADFRAGENMNKLS